MDRPEQTLSAVLDAGELLLTSGAEAARVEDTMRRLARAYGFVRADVLTITASMAVTVRTADGQVITQTRRILRRGTDMRCIEAVNELSREVCVNPIPPEELHARLEAIRTAPDKLRAAAGVSDHVRLVRCVLRRHLERRHSRHAVQRAAVCHRRAR